MRSPLWRRLLAELVGTGLLVAVVVGSGIMASQLTSDTGLQLLANSLATALGLGVLILVLGPVSGAHFNPVVSAVDAVVGRGAGLRPAETSAYIGVQILGAAGGAVLADAMFGVPVVIAATDRLDAGRLFGEVVATAGLILVILGLARSARAGAVALAVGAYIGAAYWFTSSTSFANPAVTIGRMFSDTFAGIAPLSALAFIAAQLAGGALGLALAAALFPRLPDAAADMVVRTTPQKEQS